MMRDSDFRTVNPILNAKPRFGPIPAELVVPWIGMILVVYPVCSGLLHLSYLWSWLTVVWACATWWLLNGSRPYRFQSKFIRSPNWVRGYVHYQSIQDYRRTAIASRSSPRRRTKTR